jgi:hypothetical protein
MRRPCRPSRRPPAGEIKPRLVTAVRELVLRRHLQAEIFELLAYRRIVQGVDRRGIRFSDDALWRVLGYPKAGPQRHVEAGAIPRCQKRLPSSLQGANGSSLRARLMINSAAKLSMLPVPLYGLLRFARNDDRA